MANASRVRGQDTALVSGIFIKFSQVTNILRGGLQERRRLFRHIDLLEW